MNTEWSGAASSAGTWDGFSLVIDTTEFAGKFEREMLAACFGLVSPFPTEDADTISDAYDGPDMSMVVGALPGEPNGDAVEVYPTPGWSNDGNGGYTRIALDAKPECPAYKSVRVALERPLTTEELAGVRRRAEAFAAQKGFVIEGYRYIRERTETQSVDACKAALTPPQVR